VQSEKKSPDGSCLCFLRSARKKEIKKERVLNALHARKKNRPHSERRIRIRKKTRVPFGVFFG
jgi:hypothetical protein